MTAHTLALAADGRSVAIPHRTVSGVDRVLTKVRIALETRRGTWLSDDLFGLPTDVWSERPSTTTAEIESEVRLLLGSVSGVLEVQTVDIARAPSLSVAARLLVDGGADDVRVARIEAAAESASDPRLIALGIQVSEHPYPDQLLPGRR